MDLFRLRRSVRQEHHNKRPWCSSQRILCTTTKINAPQLVKFDKNKFKRFAFLDRRGRRIKRHDEFGHLVSEIVIDGAVHCRSPRRRGRCNDRQSDQSRVSAQRDGAFDHVSCKGQHRVTPPGRRTCDRPAIGETSHTEMGNAHHDGLPRMGSARSDANRGHSSGDRRTFNRLGTSPQLSRARDAPGGSITPSY